ncbi:MAG: ABC transporter permease [Chloroflexota bacterium]
MQNPRETALQLGFAALAIIASLALSAGLIILIDREPLEVIETLWQGAFGSSERVAGVFNFWIPLTLSSLGLIVTFRAGLWNIGVEGQIMAGAVFASGVALFVPAPQVIRVPLAIAASVVGGVLWALLAGVLKTRLGVHEIFGGVALNAIANVITNFLVGNLWSPPGGNALDTGPFDDAARIPFYSDGFQTSIAMIVLVIVIAIAVVVMLSGTRWGLELKATGKNPRSALLLGVATEKTSLSAFAFCGALAGLAGAYRVLFFYGTLRPLASGGVGFLGILVALLVGNQALWVPLVTFAFGALLFGSTRLRITQQLDASIAKTLQGTLVLLVILSGGLRARLLNRSNQPAAEPTTTSEPNPVITEAKSYE